MSRDRDIGPIGTASRITGGLLATVLPIAFEGIGWWDVAVLVALGFIATAAASVVVMGYERYAPAALARPHAICSGPACLLLGALYAAALGLSAATPARFDVVFWGFLGLSMLLAAARGDGGCEVLAFPNAVMGRDDRVGCIVYGPIDRAEAARRSRHGSSRLSDEAS